MHKFLRGFLIVHLQFCNYRENTMNTIADNPFEFSHDNKRYHTYNYYLRSRFGKKVMKIPLNVDLGCPNRDGTKGIGGCKFCSAYLSGEFAGDPCDDIRTQFESVRARMNEKCCISPTFRRGQTPMRLLRGCARCTRLRFPLKTAQA